MDIRRGRTSRLSRSWLSVSWVRKEALVDTTLPPGLKPSTSTDLVLDPGGRYITPYTEATSEFFYRSEWYEEDYTNKLCQPIIPEPRGDSDDVTFSHSDRWKCNLCQWEEPHECRDWTLMVNHFLIEHEDVCQLFALI